MSFNFQDIFKSGFLENAAAITIFDMVLAVILSFAVGLFIFSTNALRISLADFFSKITFKRSAPIMIIMPAAIIHIQSFICSYLP